MTRALRWAAGAVGVAVMAAAVVGVWTDRRYTAPAGLLRWLAGSIVVSDLVIAPLVLAVGFLVARLVPVVVRAAVVAGLMAAGTILLVGVPIVIASHRPRANPTVLPLDYGRGLLWTLLGVVGCSVLGAGLSLRRSRRRPPAEPGPG